MIRIYTPISDWYMKICQKVYLFLKPLLHFPGHLQFVGKHRPHLLSPFKKRRLNQVQHFVVSLQFHVQLELQPPKLSISMLQVVHWATH